MTYTKTLAITLNTSWNIYNFRIGLLKALEKQGYKIIVIAPRDAYVSKLEALGFEYHEIKMNNKGTNPIEEMKLLWDFYWLYRRIKPDVLLHYTIKPNIYGSIAGRWLNIPMISNISGLGTVFLDNSFSSKVGRYLYKVALKGVDKVFFQNHDDRALFTRLHLLDASQSDVLAGSGIDTQKFSPIESPPNKRMTFLFIARLLRDKGLVEYVRASRMMQEKYSVNCQILGAYYPNNPTAITKSDMSAWVEEGCVEYLGVSDEVALVIAKADCVVLPSYREGLSRVLLESASMAKALITSNVAGCKEVVDDGINGYLCEVKSSHSLFLSMEKMYALSYDKRQEMGKKGREKVMKEFDEKLVIEKYEEVLSQLR
jgi:glycosyltransferase involved in cell wall biosynthesis